VHVCVHVSVSACDSICCLGIHGIHMSTHPRVCIHRSQMYTHTYKTSNKTPILNLSMHITYAHTNAYRSMSFILTYQSSKLTQFSVLFSIFFCLQFLWDLPYDNFCALAAANNVDVWLAPLELGEEEEGYAGMDARSRTEIVNDLLQVFAQHEQVLYMQILVYAHSCI